MKRFRVGFTDNHLSALLIVWRLINATADSVAKSQNMPKLANYWKKYLNDLHSEGLIIGKLIHSTSRTGKGGRRLGEFFALTEKGAETIAETLNIAPETVFFPLGGIQSKSPFQFPHRAMLIQLFSMFLGHEKSSEGRFKVLDLVPEYRYIGSNRLGTGRKATRVTVEGESIIPDGIIRFSAGEKIRLATVEFHRETDTKRIIEQLRKHALATDKKCFSEMFNHPHSNYVLSVYEDPQKLKNVQERIKAGEFPNFEKYALGYHFASLDNILNFGIDKAFFGINGEESKIWN
jgi:hypothetical protein